MTPLYTASASTTGGRNGHIRSSDGPLHFDVSVPKSMGGPGKPATSNPEQLFAAGYSACFGAAVEMAALQKRMRIEPITITADVTVGKEESGAFQLAVTLTGRIPGHTHSRATRGNIEVRLIGAT